MESLERLQGLYEDLVVFSETRLANVERLWLELEASIEDFRKLFDKPPKTNSSRESLATGIYRHQSSAILRQLIGDPFDRQNQDRKRGIRSE